MLIVRARAPDSGRALVRHRVWRAWLWAVRGGSSPTRVSGHGHERRGSQSPPHSSRVLWPARGSIERKRKLGGDRRTLNHKAKGNLTDEPIRKSCSVHVSVGHRMVLGGNKYRITMHYHLYNQCAIDNLHLGGQNKLNPVAFNPNLMRHSVRFWEKVTKNASLMR